MKTYVGTVDALGEWRVHVERDDGRRWPLLPRTEISNHSPTGFAWGYAGSGPAQLALAICVDCLGRDGAIPRVYQTFKAERIARLPQDQGWRMTETEVLRWMAEAVRSGRVALEGAAETSGWNVVRLHRPGPGEGA